MAQEVRLSRADQDILMLIKNAIRDVELSVPVLIFQTVITTILLALILWRVW